MTSPHGELKHVQIYFEKGRYGGWPANGGIWSWGNEILVGFVRGYYKNMKKGHPIDPHRPRKPVFARSLDGGQTWSMETGFRLPDNGGEKLSHPMDFTNPNFVLSMRKADNNTGPSYFFHSQNRGRTWKGPFRLPDMGTPGIAARTDYLIEGQRSLRVFLTAAKSNQLEGRPFCAITTDGGLAWEKISWIGPEPEGYSIMPTSVRLSPTELLVVVRRKERRGSNEGNTGWLSCYMSDDNGCNWTHIGKPATNIGSNPPALIKLGDGRLCLTYGVRKEPYRICVRLSSDQGKTWSDEIVLRDDGANGDIGYCRTVQRPDGRVVTVYYFNDLETGPERYIGATIWNPMEY